jgi:hypothetical protein
MDDGQTKVAQMGVKAQGFAQGKVAAFTHTPMTKVDNKHAAALTKLGAAITGLGGKAAIQKGGGFSEKTGEKETSRHDLEELVKQTNTTAGSIADDQGTPEIMSNFRMPHGSGDEELKTKAKSMAKAIDDLGLDDEFESYHLPGHAAVLTNAANNFTTSEAEQGGALGEQAGATTAIKGFIKQIKTAVKILNAIYHNVFAGDPETLGAWKTVSHVEKVASKKKPKPGGPKPPTPPSS